VGGGGGDFVVLRLPNRTSGGEYLGACFHVTVLTQFALTQRGYNSFEYTKPSLTPNHTFISLVAVHTMSFVLPHLDTGWHIDQAIMSEEERVVIIRFGRDWDLIA